MPIQYNLKSLEWIPLDNTKVSLREAMLNMHKYKHVNANHPLEVLSCYRYLLYVYASYVEDFGKPPPVAQILTPS